MTLRVVRGIKHFATLIGAVLLTSDAFAEGGFVPRNGYMPDATTAVAVARAVLIPICGADTIHGEEPLTARREGDVRDVSGKLYCLEIGQRVGGVAEVELSAVDGRILSVIRSE